MDEEDEADDVPELNEIVSLDLPVPPAAPNVADDRRKQAAKVADLVKDVSRLVLAEGCAAQVGLFVPAKVITSRLTACKALRPDIWDKALGSKSKKPKLH